LAANQQAERRAYKGSGALRADSEAVRSVLIPPQLAFRTPMELLVPVALHPAAG